MRGARGAEPTGGAWPSRSGLPWGSLRQRAWRRASPRSGTPGGAWPAGSGLPRSGTPGGAWPAASDIPWAACGSAPGGEPARGADCAERKPLAEPWPSLQRAGAKRSLVSGSGPDCDTFVTQLLRSRTLSLPAGITMIRTHVPSAIPSSHRRPRNRLAAARRVQQALAHVRDLEQLFRTLHKELSCVTDTTGFILGVFDEGSQMIEVVGQMEAGRALPGGSFPLGHGFLSEVIRTRQSRLIRHWSVEGPRVQVQYATNTPGLPESTITVPLLVGDRTIGVLSLQSYVPDTYDEDDVFFLESVASQVALTIDGLRRGLASEAVHRASKLEAVLSSMTDGLLILDADGRIVSLNPPARTIFGSMGAGVILGQPLDHEQWGQWPLGAKVVGEALAPVIEALHRGEARRDVEVEVNAGGRRVLSFSSAPISDAVGGHAGGVIVIRDVTNERDIARL